VSAPARTLAEADRLRTRVEAIRWWHRIDLGDGIVTPGMDDPSARLRHLALPESLAGKSVLDVGAWDGFFSFEAERRGASRVLATDSFAWRGEGWFSKAGFDLARSALGSRIEDKSVEVLDISPSTTGTFDVVLFLSVLYHMPHPLLALERLFSVTRELLVLETHVDMLGARRPTMAFYPGKELAGDRTNWWGPNPRAVEAMLRVVGFREVRQVSSFGMPHRGRLRAWRAARQVAGHSLRMRRPDFSPLRQGRVVFHARP
jgi:tRNA (mo5U34)-methyltransferase